MICPLPTTDLIKMEEGFQGRGVESSASIRKFVTDVIFLDFRNGTVRLDGLFVLG